MTVKEEKNAAANEEMLEIQLCKDKKEILLRMMQAKPVPILLELPDRTSADQGRSMPSKPAGYHLLARPADKRQFEAMEKTLMFQN